MMKAQIHKRKIYLKPRPKGNIPQGLVIKLNKPLREGVEPFLFTDVLAGQKEYKLPDLPEGYWVEFAFIKGDKAIIKEDKKDG